MMNCECKCNCKTLPTIKQGDDCYLGVTIRFNGTPIPKQDFYLIEKIEFCFEGGIPHAFKPDEIWSDALHVFLLPVTQEETQMMGEGKTDLDVRVKFYGGNVLGARQQRNLNVLPANSWEVI